MPIDLWWYQSRGCWCADVPDGEGRKRLYLGSNEAKAKAGLHRHLASYYDGLGENAADSKPTVRRPGNTISLVELAVRFIRWNKSNRAPGTWKNYRDGLKHIVGRYKNKLAIELTPSDVEQVKSSMIGKGYAARTINIMVTSIKRLYNWAVKQRLLPDNALAGVEHVSAYVNAPDHPQPKHLPLERAIQCIELCRESPPLGDLCEMLLLTGMRVGELVRVTWQDIDFGQRLISLARHKTSGRNNSRPRAIPLCDRAIEILRRQADEDVDAEAPVFRGIGGQPFTVDTLHCRLQRLRLKHEELATFSFHRLRHTCATYLARLRVPERIAQAILGHNSTLMTRYYTATGRDEMLEAVERLSQEANLSSG